MPNIEKREKKVASKKVNKFIFVLIVIGGIFGSGYYFGQAGIGAKTKPDDVDLTVFWEAWNTLKEKSVQDTDNKKMVEGAISGMMSSINDPYTTYFTKKENERFREDIGGEFSGIGIEIVLKNGFPTVVAPLSDTPAEKAGLKPNDVILEVDGAKTDEIGFDETINRIRGAEGTKVKLKIARASEEQPIEVEVTRQKIVVKSVTWDTKQTEGKKIMVIKIRQFGDDTDALFADAAKEAVKNKPDGIVLDLRNDPGGYLETAINLASYFIPEGTIVSEKGKNNTSKDYASNKNGKLKDFKVVVLTNGGSASASEILAGALQDRKDAQIIGEKTFGKGSVQELIDLKDGSAVKVTIAKWFTPNGRQINGQGLEPTIKIEKDEKATDDNQLTRALNYIVTGK